MVCSVNLFHLINAKREVLDSVEIRIFVDDNQPNKTAILSLDHILLLSNSTFITHTLRTDLPTGVVSLQIVVRDKPVQEGKSVSWLHFGMKHSMIAELIVTPFSSFTPETLDTVSTQFPVR